LDARCHVRYVRPCPVADDLSILSERIRALLEPSSDGSPFDTTVVEHTLTDGYARALALEGERLRTEDRIRVLAGDAGYEGELRALKSRLGDVDSELTELRDLLKDLAATL
jgi:hypothetical protein